MLVDSITLILKAGDGGNGAATFMRNGQTAKGGPDGGNGGNGGDIYFEGSTDVNDLREFRFKKKIVAEKGVDGRRSNLFGKNAPSVTVFLPLGTQVTDTRSGRTFEIRYLHKPMRVAHGGHGGRGNVEFKTATNQTPTFAEKGEKGEEFTVHLELKIIAEIGLIGLPNAGKSSLLAVLTNARPEIGAYPFTTLDPNIGMMGAHAVADIPGLIEGASSGKGLGFKFLKHIEKTKILVHCIDVTGDNPAGAYAMVREELGKYNEELLLKPEILLLTKTDCADDKRVQETASLFTKDHEHVVTCSVMDLASIKELRKMLDAFCETH